MDSIPNLKQCTACKIELPATTEYFYASAKGKYGVLAICKSCHIKRSQERDNTLKVYNGETKVCTRCNTEFPATKEHFHIKKQCQYALSEMCKGCAKKRQAAMDNTLKVYSGETKICTICQQNLPAKSEYFIPSKHGKYGLAAECKTCREKEHQQRMAEDEAYADRRRATGRRYKSRNMDKARQWQIDNPEKVLESSRQYRKNNPDKTRAAVRKWEKEHPEKRMIYHAARQAKKTGAGGRYTVEDLVTLYEMQKGFCCWCGCEMVNRLIHKNASRKIKFTIDHIKPVDRGGSSYPHNLVLACASCNSKKNKRVLFVEWQPSNMLEWMRDYVQNALNLES